ncbi:MAG TPA: hypothetical protein VGM78_09975, partial [Ilumatobacteraceae bacterium]
MARAAVLVLLIGAPLALSQPAAHAARADDDDVATAHISITKAVSPYSFGRTDTPDQFQLAIAPITAGLP